MSDKYRGIKEWVYDKCVMQIKYEILYSYKAPDDHHVYSSLHNSYVDNHLVISNRNQWKALNKNINEN